MAEPVSRATVSLPRPILARVDRLARAEYRSRSDIVRRALVAYLDAPAPTRPLRPEAFAEAAERLPEAPPAPDEIAAFARRRSPAGRGGTVSLAALNQTLGQVAGRGRPKRPARA